jgi:hypothetical protein
MVLVNTPNYQYHYQFVHQLMLSLLVPKVGMPLHVHDAFAEHHQPTNTCTTGSIKLHSDPTWHNCIGLTLCVEGKEDVVIKKPFTHIDGLVSYAIHSISLDRLIVPTIMTSSNK